MSFQWTKLWARATSIFCILLTLVVMSTHVAHAAIQPALKSNPQRCTCAASSAVTGSFLGSSSVDKKHMNLSGNFAQTIERPALKSLTSNTVIALRADNGLFLSRINYEGTSGTNPIEAAKSTIDDYSKFTIVRLDNGNFTLQADNGLFLSRINYGGAHGTNPIQAAKKTADPYSQFAIILFLANGKIALQADNGLYLSRINYGGTSGTNPIEAAKTTLDPYSQFEVTIISQP